MMHVLAAMAWPEEGDGTVMSRCSESWVRPQVFVPSKDGTRIPMFIVAHQNVTLDGNNPTYLYAYGGACVNDAPAPLTRGVLLGTSTAA